MNSVRDSYDIVADEYVRRIFNELEGKPLDRQLLERFAKSVARGGTICDLGCGPGHVTRYVSDCGVTSIGIDLSPKMIEHAKRLNPKISFFQDDMLGLKSPDAQWDGITAFYSIVNFTTDQLVRVFSEMRRTLRPDSPLLLAFHAGDEHIHLDEWWDLPVSLDFYLFDPSEIKRLLEKTGFRVEDTILREPYPEVEHQSKRAYLFCRK